jgi:DNA-binding response OmpR family regulator
MEECIAATIYIMDDEHDIVDLVGLNLKKEGYRVEGFTKVDGFTRGSFVHARHAHLDLMTPVRRLQDLQKPPQDARYKNIAVIM